MPSYAGGMSNPAGTWNVNVSTPFGDQQLSISIVVDGSDVSGVATHESGTYPFSGGTYVNDKVTFEVSLTSPIKADLKIKVQADGDTITGKAKAGMLSLKVKGTRAG